MLVTHDLKKYDHDQIISQLAKYPVERVMIYSLGEIPYSQKDHKNFLEKFVQKTKQTLHLSKTVTVSSLHKKVPTAHLQIYKMEPVL
jgi:hypothetical protein